jgi:hypothetical protein
VETRIFLCLSAGGDSCLSGPLLTACRQRMVQVATPMGVLRCLEVPSLLQMAVWRHCVAVDAPSAGGTRGLVRADMPRPRHVLFRLSQQRCWAPTICAIQAQQNDCTCCLQWCGVSCKWQKSAGVKQCCASNVWVGFLQCLHGESCCTL